MDARENPLAIREIVQADERARFHEVAEEVFCGVVGGYAGGDDDSRRAVRRDDGAGGFGEYGIGVDVAASGEREASAAAREAACGFGYVDGVREFLCQVGVGFGERVYEALALRLVARGGYLAVALSEKFLFLQLDALPGRVAENHVEPAAREHFGELKGPVKERVDCGRGVGVGA